MSSGDKRMNFYGKKFFHLNQVQDNFLGYLKGLVEATRARIFPYSGLFNDVSMASSHVDTIYLDPAPEGMDAHGHEMRLGTVMLGTTPVTDIFSFPNSNGVVYSVGMRWSDSVPSGIETNVRTKAAEYALMEEVVGEVDEPDDVSLVLSTPLKLKLVIDYVFLCQTPVDNSGRKVLAWLKDPVSQVEGVALYEATSEWDGTHNYIEIPYTPSQGPLGQTSPNNPISMDSTDYQVWVEGVTIVPKATKDLSADGDYVFLGEVTGVGRGGSPTEFDVSGQTHLGRASGLATGAISGSPYSEGASNVQQVFEDVVGWLNATYERISDLTASEIATTAINGALEKLGYTGTTPVGGTVQSYFAALLGFYNNHALGSADKHADTDVTSAVTSSGDAHDFVGPTLRKNLTDLLLWFNLHVYGIIDRHNAEQVNAAAINAPVAAAADPPYKLGYTGTTPSGETVQDMLDDFLGLFNSIFWRTYRVRAGNPGTQTVSGTPVALVLANAPAQYDFPSNGLDPSHAMFDQTKPERLTFRKDGVYRVRATAMFTASNVGDARQLSLVVGDGAHAVGTEPDNDHFRYIQDLSTVIESKFAGSYNITLHSEIECRFKAGEFIEAIGVALGAGASTVDVPLFMLEAHQVDLYDVYWSW
jgi:hypothetical protein